MNSLAEKKGENEVWDCFGQSGDLQALSSSQVYPATQVVLPVLRGKKDRMIVCAGN